MNYFPIKAMQTDHPDEGTLQLYVLSSIRNQSEDFRALRDQEYPH